MQVPTNQHYPYRPNSTLDVRLFSPAGLPIPFADEFNTETKSRKPHLPCQLQVKKTLSGTLSCVLLVGPPDEGDLISWTNTYGIESPSTSSNLMILKLLDRRFADGMREQCEASEWTPELEAHFDSFNSIPEGDRPEIRVSGGFDGDSWYDGNEGTETTGHAHSRDGSRTIPQERWSPGHREAYLQKKCDRAYEMELQVYNQLRDIQGDQIPRLYATALVSGVDGDKRAAPWAKGILMEYLADSFSLRDIPYNVPDQTLWQGIGEAAVKLVQQVGDLGVLNRDVRLDNILVVPVHSRLPREFQGFDPSSELLEEEHIRIQPLTNASQQFKLVMIDFGLARVQAPDESDEEFRKARLSQDEEGAVGFVLEGHLKKILKRSRNKEANILFRFKHSYRLRRYWDTDDADI